ncbi:p-type calcium transporter [Niveomyces insectorum RCEF 264]|uniref:Calcium-transporting ATPase n=1 Tax=Niveomyces insectorum RCEF 264 TaxID=1081102 RepID=A0A167VI25_9HYPO|nr:p-type calcium transporter [Niveomyces insectorum RCEF 264]
MAPDNKEADAPRRRPRAPTITIDTAAVSSQAPGMPPEGAMPIFSHSPVSLSDDTPQSPGTSNAEALSAGRPSLQQPSGPGGNGSGSGGGGEGGGGGGGGGAAGATGTGRSTSRPQLQASTSFESRDSRPTSPHNVSSPIAGRNGDRTHGFLAVPNSHRSRQNSVDSEDGSRSLAISQGETVIGSSSYGGDKHSRSMSMDATNDGVMNDPDALKPDLGKEADFQVDHNQFAFSPGQLNKMFDPRSLAAFWSMGGLDGLEKGLRTDRNAGLSVEETSLDGAISFEEATRREPPGKPAPAVLSHDGSSKMPAVSTSPAATASLPSHSLPPPPPPPPPPSTHHPRTSTSASAAHRNGAPFADRKRVFKDNHLPEKKAKSLWQLVLITFNDKILIMLSIAAAVSLAIGLYQTFGQKHDANNPPVEWIEGVAIIVAILIVVIVGSLNDWQKERQFAKLNRKKTDRLVKVVRSGRLQEISVFDILVGDVMRLETGDMVPVDGVLIEGHNIKCDESQATGESDLIRKRPADEVYAAIENHENLKKMDPLIQSGSRVMEGLGTFLVTSTGVYSSYGKTLMSLHDDPEITPLQAKLNVIADYIAKVGGAAALLLFVVLFIEFLVDLHKQPPSVTPAQKGQDFLNIFIVVVTIIVVAVPEGLPLAVTLALSYATARMVRENNLVRQLKACEVMGNATTICSDKTGTLTQNRMRVVAGTIGTALRFGESGLSDVDGSGNENDNDNGSGSGNGNGDTSKAKDTAVTSTAALLRDSREVSEQELMSSLSPAVRDLLLKSIAVNSTAFEGEVHGKPEFIGSKTESALLTFAREHMAMNPVSEERANAPKTLQLIPFDSGRKCMGIVLEMPNGRGARLLVKGASEIMLEHCTRILRDPTQDISLAPLGEDTRETLQALIESYASSSLRTIGLAFRDFPQWPPPQSSARRTDAGTEDVVFEDVFKKMAFISLVGIKDPLRNGVREAVRDCQRAGVVVRMVTGDNRLTAQAIARDCGILQEDSEVMEGVVFRNMNKNEQLAIIPRLHVLARSSPEDKRILVQRLKEQGETVAVTGDGTNDAPALKLADVGFSMGISGTEVAKEASAIILMDDNFASIVKALRWGRAVNDAVKRFLQFQLTVNVTAVVLTFVSAVASGDETSVLTAVQLLWVNLIMDTLAALALATDPPHESVLDRKPERKGASIVSTTMWKMIVGQAIYQLAITFMLYFGGQKVLPSYEHADKAQIQTLVFNTFVWMQIFNQWNNRRLDNRFNIFEGMTKNWFFIAVSIVIIGGQILIIMVGGRAFSIAPRGQTGLMWGYALAFGFVSIPVGVLIRLVPDAFVERLVPQFVKRRLQARRDNKPVPGVTVSSDAYAYDERFDYYPAPLADVRDELAWLKRVRGGRISNLRFAIQHPRETFTLPRSRSASHSRSNSQSLSHSRSNSFQMPQGPSPQTPTRENSFGSVHGGSTPGAGGGGGGGGSSSGGGGGGSGVNNGLGAAFGAGLTTSPSASPDARRRSRSMRSIRSRSNSALGAPSVMAGIIAGSVAVGWSPIDRSNSNSNLHGPPSTGSPGREGDGQSGQSAQGGQSGNNNNDNNNNNTSNRDFGLLGASVQPTPARQPSPSEGPSGTLTRDSSTARLLRDNTDGTNDTVATAGTAGTSETAVGSSRSGATDDGLNKTKADAAKNHD